MTIKDLLDQIEGAPMTLYETIRILENHNE